MSKAVVPEELAHMRPVLLFAMSIVVLAISPAAGPGQLDCPPVQMPMQRPVKKLSAIVSMEVLHDKGHGGFQFAQLDQHRLATLVPDSPVLRPTTEKLGKRERINII